MSPQVTIVVPTFNEGGNVRELVDRLRTTLVDRSAEVLFVDDSTDDTPEIIAALPSTPDLNILLLHRIDPVGGLAGAVSEGIRQSRSDYVVVMDGDLQHPPEMVSLMLETALNEGSDMVVASRYCGEGDASGLSSNFRRSVSSGSTLLAQTCFPRRVGKVCTDPMTGFFCFRREAVDLSRLRPRGFKILLEILARHDLKVSELPFVFGERKTGESKASWRNGLLFVWQMLALRLGRMERFAIVGGLGTVLNLVVLSLLLRLTDVHYLPAAVLASEVAIVHNFLMQERFVFRDLRGGQQPYGKRFLIFLGFNNVETLLRLPVLYVLVSGLGLYAVAAQAATLFVAFFLRFFFVTRVVYRPRPSDTPALDPSALTSLEGAA
jgi:dolichol-phosphate mannosyltransferase